MMLKAIAFACLSLAFASAPALAQRNVPISQGVTSSDLAAQVEQSRQQTAAVTVNVTALQGEVTQLTGRIEELEFNLRQAQDQNEQLARDNETLVDEIGALQMQADQQSQAIDALYAALQQAGMEIERPQPIETYPGVETPDALASVATDPSVDQDGGGVIGRSLSNVGPQSLMTRAQQAAEQQGLPAADQADAGASGGLQLQTGELPEGVLGTIAASELPGEAGPLFAMAKSRLIRFDYAGAEEAFRAFIDQFGADPQAGEAHYWLGESLYQQRAFAESGAAYTTMIRSYPDDVRAPDALVKLARAMRLIGDTEKACLALNTLPKRYPDASDVTRDLAAVELTRSRCDVSTQID